MNIRIYILISLIIIYYLLDNNFPPNKLLLSTPSRESFDKETFDIDTKSIAKNTKSIGKKLTNINQQCILSIVNQCSNMGNTSNKGMLRAQTICNCNIKDKTEIKSLNYEELESKNETCIRLIND